MSKHIINDSQSPGVAYHEKSPGDDLRVNGDYIVAIQEYQNEIKKLKEDYLFSSTSFDDMDPNVVKETIVKQYRKIAVLQCHYISHQQHDGLFQLKNGNIIPITETEWKHHLIDPTVNNSEGEDEGNHYHYDNQNGHVQLCEPIKNGDRIYYLSTENGSAPDYQAVINEYKKANELFLEKYHPFPDDENAKEATASTTTTSTSSSSSSPQLLLTKTKHNNYDNNTSSLYDKFYTYDIPDAIFIIIIIVVVCLQRRSKKKTSTNMNNNNNDDRSKNKKERKLTTNPDSSNSTKQQLSEPLLDLAIV